MGSEGTDVLGRLREGVHGIAWRTPQRLVADQPVVLVGVIERVAAGPDRVTAAWHGPVRHRAVLVGVSVLQVLKDGEGIVHGPAVDVSLPRGDEALRPDGTPLRQDPHPTLAEVQAALPAGLRVLVASRPERRHGTTDAAVLLDGRHPQKLVVDRAGCELPEWPGRTFADLLTDVRRGLR
ncbi:MULTISPECIES: hypothetical protein [unclassified Nocardioides]|uniref:hypothetical protein n=1 Tax=unclassified Nocardioides TaxID=2615069 RepID=UPI0030142DDD